MFNFSNFLKKERPQEIEEQKKLLKREADKGEPVQHYDIVCNVCKQYIWGHGIQLTSRIFFQLILQGGLNHNSHLQNVFDRDKDDIVGHCPICDRSFDNINFMLRPIDSKQWAQRMQKQMVPLQTLTGDETGTPAA